MNVFVELAVLRGEHVQLEPLELSHADELLQAASDGELWKLWYCSVPKPEKIHDYITHAIEQRNAGQELAFAVRQVQGGQPGRVVGSTRFCRIDAVNRRAEIGYTWYAQALQGTLINAESKLLLLQHAFENLRCIAVEFRTHWMNHRSRAAIAKLGAKQDGVLRNHVIMNGTLRDTVVFSIIESEWPTVKQHLQFRLSA